MRLQRALSALGLAWSTSALAQEPCPTRVAGAPAELCHLDPWPGAVVQSFGTYPATLLQVGVAGVIDVRVVVDTTGTPIVSSFRATRTTHDAFVRMVASALPHWRFAPPRIGGAATMLRYEATLAFHPVPLEGTNAVQVTLGRAGTAPAPRDFGGPSRRETWVDSTVTSAELLGIQSAVLAWTSRSLAELSRRPTICLEALGDHASTLAAAAAPEERVVLRPQCPRTYTSMFYSGRAEDRAPPGWIDPVHVAITGVERVLPGIVRVYVTRRQGMRRDSWQCGARETAGRWGDVRCVLYESAIS